MGEACPVPTGIFQPGGGCWPGGGPQPDVPTPPGNEHRRLPENLLGALPLPLPAASGKSIPFPSSPLSGRLPDSPASQPPEPVRAR